MKKDRVIDELEMEINELSSLIDGKMEGTVEVPLEEVMEIYNNITFKDNLTKRIEQEKRKRMN